MAGDAERRARLAAIANGGLQGANAYDDAQRQAADRRVAAIDSITQDAANLNAPQSAVDALTAMVGDPYDQTAAVLDDASSSYAKQVGTMAESDGVGTGSAPAPAPVKPWGGYGNEKTYLLAVEGKAQAAQEKAAADAKAQRDAANQSNLKEGFLAATGQGTASKTLDDLNQQYNKALDDFNKQRGVDAYVNSPEGTTVLPDLPMPPELTALKAQRDQAQAAYDAATTNSNAVQAAGKLSIAPLDKALADSMDPNNRYRYEREVALGLGADPDATVGRFQPPSDADRLKALQDQQALDNYIQSGGYTSPQDQRAATGAQHDLAVDQAAAALGTTSTVINSVADDARVTPDMVISTMQDPSWAAISQLAGSTSSYDDFASALSDLNNKAPDDQKMTPEEVRVVLAYYGPLLDR